MKSTFDRLTDEQLRGHLERKAKGLSTDDQVRLLRLIEALQAGADVDPAAMERLTPEDLRAWVDTLGQPKD